MRYGTITPTDIDGLIEYRDLAYVIYEFKLEGRDLPKGQRLALERLCDDLATAGKVAVVLVGSHRTPIGQDIACANVYVDEYRHNGQWHTPRFPPPTLREATDEWLDFAGSRDKMGSEPPA